MYIVGGIYKEQCCVPTWDAVFGSGGRAAAAVSGLTSSCILHAYAEDFDSEGIASLNKLGIGLRLSPRPNAIVFSYFHPLSRPHIQPSPSEIERQPPIQVSGDAVLRFGFIEGDAIVNAHRAVYDPQTWRNPAIFSENGSIAGELAIVLNELELRFSTGHDDLGLAASDLIKHQGAAVVVVKRGIKGAMIFERGGRKFSVPAYRSPRVFKIGTGDVFSAIFALFWAEKKMHPLEAADIASRSVSAYCTAGRLPLEDDELQNLLPIKCEAFGPVLLEGMINTLGRRYTMEEARFVLQELGVDVICPALDITVGSTAKSVLIIADGLDDETAKKILSKTVEIPKVLLSQRGKQDEKISVEDSNIITTDDFASSLYLAAWATAEKIE